MINLVCKGSRVNQEQAVAVKRTACIRACFYPCDDLDQSACSSVSSIMCEGAFVVTIPVIDEKIYKEI